MSTQADGRKTIAFVLYPGLTPLPPTPTPGTLPPPTPTSAAAAARAGAGAAERRGWRAGAADA